MKIYRKNRLWKFTKRHRRALPFFQAWIKDVEEAEWRDENDIRKNYRDPRIVSPDRVVFKIDKFNYRIDTIIDYEEGEVLIVRAGTHEDYNKWKFKD